MRHNRRYDRPGTDRARELRREMTRQERRLWYDFLCRYPVKFYRQRAVDRYILDFYCSRAGIAVELDGSQHYEETGQKQDADRTEALNRMGITVLRFSNLEVDQEFEAVCAEIDRRVRRRVEEPEL